MKTVYIIVDSDGGISVTFGGKGTVYATKELGEKALKQHNEWGKVKGYGPFELIECKVVEK